MQMRKGGEGFARAGVGGDEDVFVVVDVRPAVELGRGGLGEVGVEPFGDEGVEEVV